MQKQLPLFDTKGTQNSFPIIFNSLKDKHNQSHKSLFKNDSQSSEEPTFLPQQPKLKAFNNFAEINQIKRFLKKGEQINLQTIKKLKDDKLINDLVKNDRSSASLYKNSSRHLDFLSQEDPKQKEIKRIYLSHKKTKSRPFLLMPTYRGKKSSIQVQTDFIDQSIHAKKQLLNQPSSQNIYPSQNYLNFKTIQAIEQQSNRNSQHRANFNSIVHEDAQANHLLPYRQRKNISNRSKAISVKTNIQGYINSIGRTEFEFYDTVNKMNNRYREYKDQETIFSKTIDIKPLIPFKETLNTFQEIQTKNSHINIGQVRGMNNMDAKNGQIQQRFNKNPRKFKSQNQIYLEQQNKKINQIEKRMNMGNEKESPEDSSLIAQQTENISPQRTNASREVFSRRQFKSKGHEKNDQSEMASQMPQKKGKIDKRMRSSGIQVPSVNELKIGQIQTKTTNIKLLHPIRQDFAQRQMNWVRTHYNPKHQLFKGLDIEQFQIKKYKNGVYFGQLDEQGHKDGKGIIFYYNGKIYEGQLKKDLKQGKGLQIYPDGSRFKGDFVDGIKEGKGMFEWSNGEVYDGQWHNGKKYGSGMWKGVDGDSYIGQWKNGKVEGFGVFLMKNGSRYQGQFKNSLKHGMGTQRFYNNQTYVGNYEKNRPNGMGEYYWSNGDYYKGQFCNGLRHGKGYFKQGKSVIEYNGDYQNDKKCGYGQINYGNDMIYVGNFQNNFRHGYGELHQQQKMKYKGYWINDNQVEDANQIIQESQKNIIQNTRNNKKETNAPPIKVQARRQSKTINVSSIMEDEMERQESLPKIIPKSGATRQNNHASYGKKSLTIHSHSHSISPNDEGYRRPCKCNRKH